MRIVLVCRVYATQRQGGMPFVVQDRAEELAKECFDVHVFTTGPKLETSHNGVSVHQLDCAPQVYTKDFAESCLRESKRLAPDVLHLDSFDRENVWWSGLKPSITMHGFGWGSVLSDWNRFRCGLGKEPVVSFKALKVESEALKLARSVIAISEHEAWLLKDTFGLGNTATVKNPIPNYFFENRVPCPADGYWLCAGNPGTSKNRNFEQVPFITKRKILVVKTTPRADMPQRYDGACGLVIPTFWAQGFDLTVAESLARQRPIVCFYTGSYSRFSDENPYTVAVPVGDWEILTSVLRTTLPIVPADAADVHRPETHVKNWLARVA